MNSTTSFGQEGMGREWRDIFSWRNLHVLKLENLATYVGIVAYADDLLLLSPTLNGSQEMTKTCEDYGNTHNLTFSTDPILTKCKTKCLAFL